jgi:hypothetical protein
MKLADDFTLDRYGLHVRLVNENDADFIVKLRVDPKLGRFIHATDNDVEKQKEWIRQYKIREKDGKEYYFIYYYEGEPIGLYRVYDIKTDYATGGSWVCKPGLPFELPILTLVIFREIIFNDLNLSYERYDIRKKNYKSLRISDFFGGIKTMETNLDYYFELSKETFLQRREYVLELLNMNK